MPTVAANAINKTAHTELKQLRLETGPKGRAFLTRIITISGCALLESGTERGTKILRGVYDTKML